MKVITVKTKADRSIYFEVADEAPQKAMVKGGSVAGGKSKEIIKQLEEVGDAIADVCNTLQSQIATALDKSKPSELTLEFSLTLAGEAGIPLVTKGTAEGTFQVTAKWDFNKEV